MRRRRGRFATTEFGSRNRCGHWKRSGRAPRSGRADRRFSGPRARPDRSEFRPGRATSGRLVGRCGREHPRRLDAVEGGAQRVVAVAACGQMHGTVLIDAGASSCSIPFSSGTTSGRPCRSAHSPQPNDVDALWPLTANPPSVAWPGFKLQWIARHQPEALARAATLLMPKDYINFRLTRRRAMDESDASCTYLFDARANAWSPLLAGGSASIRSCCHPFNTHRRSSA
jgi:FGGY family of carbohydrate kinases, N-terminal domain